MKKIPPPTHIVVIVCKALLVFLILITSTPRIYSQLESQEELRMYINNLNIIDTLPLPRLLVQNLSTVWIGTSNPDSFISTYRFKEYTHTLDTGLNTIKFGTYPGPAGSCDTIGYAKYKFCIQEWGANDDYTTIDSIIIDYTDSAYLHSGLYATADLSVKYDYNDTNRFYFGIEIISYNSNLWKCVKDSFPDFSWGIWESNRDRTTNYQYPRTKSFIPEKPKDFSLSSVSGNPYLSWTSNGEPFPIIYCIYRRENSGPYYLLDSTTNTSYTDDNLDGAPCGTNHAYYFVRTKNISQGSSRISEPTDTLVIHWSYYGYDKQVASGTSLISSALFPNYPNPFNPSTTIRYVIHESKPVRLIIYDLLGREVITLVNETQEAGEYSMIWDGRDQKGHAVSSGVYIYRLKAGSVIKSGKMTLLR